jgi:NADH-quinone oxidoreductase subunit G
MISRSILKKKDVHGGKNMAKLIIDGREFSTGEGISLLQKCLSLGFDIPYFCWHPAFGSVGSCRQCAVKQFKDENDTEGKLIMSCMEPVTDGMIISISDPEAAEFRKSIIEWLMVNHPHDCPVCDEGGECHLQDMTVMTGHNYRRYRFTKRTHHNQYLGPFINHEMNRCIQCYRCVRFYRDYAGGRDFNVFSIHDHVYFGRHQDGILESEFSGNLAEVCPTGVFTDKTMKGHYTRKWDLTQAPSICSHCSVGCNVIAAERYGSLRRIQSRYNGEVNGYFICDRGRFGYEFVNDGDRISSVIMKGTQLAGQDQQMEEIIGKMAGTLQGNVVGLGSPRASLESNYMLSRLVQPDHFFAGEDHRIFNLNRKILHILEKGNIRTPSLKEIEDADAVLVLGEDLTNTAPMMALAVRQAARTAPLKKACSLKVPDWHDSAVREFIQREHGPVFTATPYPTKLSDISAGNYFGTPDDLADFGFAIARLIDRKAPGPVRNIPDAAARLAKVVAAELEKAEKPLIISGTGCLNEAVINAAYNISRALGDKNDHAQLSYAVTECNSIGLAMMTGNDLDDLIQDQERIDTLVILENDLYRRTDRTLVDTLLGRCRHVIVLDNLPNETVAHADIVMPAGTNAESQGTYVNNEGRAQRFFRVLTPRGNIKESWKWLEIMMAARDGRQFSGHGEYDELVAGLSGSQPWFRGIEHLSPPSGFRAAGQKIPRQSARYSGRTAMHADKNVNESEPPADEDSPLSFSMEGYPGQPPSSVIPFFWSPGWNSVQSVNKYQIEVGGPLHGGDPGKRLIEPGGKEYLPYFDRGKAALRPSGDQFLIVPRHHIFGGDELSSYSPAIDELSPGPYAGISTVDAEKLGIEPRDTILLRGDGYEYELAVSILQGYPEGLVLLPSGLKNFHPDFFNPLVKIIKTDHE